MPGQHYKYLLVGGGSASSAAAEAIRARDTEGSMLLVAQEVNRPYNRAALDADYLLGRRAHGELFTLDDRWFTRQHVDLRTGRRATRLNVHRQTVTLDNGDEMAFDKLLIATGGQARPLENVAGSNLPNVFYLRTIEHADRLHNAIEKARREGRGHPHGRGRCAIIGAGLLGLELAATLTRLGLAVELIESKEQAWPKYAGEAAGKLITRDVEQHGVHFHGQTVVLRLEGDGRVQRCVLSNGLTVEVDFVVPALGIIPNKELLRGTSLAAEKAILVDAYGRTSHPNIFAAGSCAAIYDTRFGKYRHLEQWGMAAITGALAGRNMTVEERPSTALERFDAINRFDSDVFDLHLSVWGEHRLVERRVVRGSIKLELPDVVEFGVAADGRVAQVLAVNGQGQEAVLSELVRRRLEVDGNAERLMDPDVPLGEILG